MSPDEFEGLVPGDTGLLLYGALLAQAWKNTERHTGSSGHTSNSGIGVGAVAGIFLSVNVVVIVAIIVIRKWLVKAKEK